MDSHFPLMSYLEFLPAIYGLWGIPMASYGNRMRRRERDPTRLTGSQCEEIW